MFPKRSLSSGSHFWLSTINSLFSTGHTPLASLWKKLTRSNKSLKIQLKCFWEGQVMKGGHVRKKLLKRTQQMTAWDRRLRWYVQLELKSTPSMALTMISKSVLCFAKQTLDNDQQLWFCRWHALIAASEQSPTLAPAGYLSNIANSCVIRTYIASAKVLDFPLSLPRRSILHDEWYVLANVYLLSFNTPALTDFHPVELLNSTTVQYPSQTRLS